TGVGVSFGLNIALNGTVAEIQDGVLLTTTAPVTGGFAVLANADSTATTIAEDGASIAGGAGTTGGGGGGGGRGSGGGTGVAAGIAIAFSENTTIAHVGSGPASALQLGGGDLQVEASHSNAVQTEARGQVSGAKTGVGAAIGLNLVFDETRAEVE